MIYECSKCLFFSENKSKFRRHLNTKKHKTNFKELETFEDIELYKKPLETELLVKRSNSAQFCSQNAEKRSNSAQFCSQNIGKRSNSAQFCSKRSFPAQFCSLIDNNLLDFEQVNNCELFINDNDNTINDSDNTISDNTINDNTISDNTINDNDNTINDNDNTISDNTISDNTINENIINNLKCDFCDYTTNRNSNFKRHIHLCKNRISDEAKYKVLYEKNENEKQNLIHKHEKEKEILYKQIDKLLEKVGHTTNNIQNNIILNNFGKEDLSHINNDFKSYLLKGPWTMIPRMIQKVHFDNSKPENKNILLPNKKEPYVKVFENATWKFRDRKETVKDLVDSNYNRLDEYYGEDGNNILNINQIKRYKSFQDKYDNYNKEIIDKVIRESELVLINQPNKNNK
uniref:C2H2-type domain-containing protein n=1 Tax=viral metagenome TaxID=1070528 RepID=A0A6C0JBC7_9ZZZZ